MNAIEEARERERNARTELLYAEVKNFDRGLYDQVVMIGTIVGHKTGSVDFAAKVERMCMGLARDAIHAATPMGSV